MNMKWIVMINEVTTKKKNRRGIAQTNENNSLLHLKYQNLQLTNSPTLNQKPKNNNIELDPLSS